MLYNILLFIGAWCMLSLILAIFLGHYLYNLND
jgi:hypothetical protein